MLTFKSLRRSIRRSGRQSVAAVPQTAPEEDVAPAAGGSGAGKQAGGAENRSERMANAISVIDVKNCSNGGLSQRKFWINPQWEAREIAYI